MQGPFSRALIEQLQAVYAIEAATRAAHRDAA